MSADARLRSAAMCAAATVCFVVFVSLYTQHALLSADEILALHPSSLNVTAIESGAAGADRLTQVTDRLTAVSVGAFGDSPFALRLPAFGATWLLLASLFAFVRRRSSNLTAAWAVVALLGTDPARFLFDARATALPGALVMLSVLSWQAVADRRSLLWLGLLAGPLAVATWVEPSSGYVAVALLIATGVDRESFQGVRRWLVIALAGVVALSAAVNAQLLQVGVHALERAWQSPVVALKQPAYAVAYLQSTYGRVFGIMTPVLLVLLGVAALRSSADHSSGLLRRSEWLLVAALALLPVWAFAPAWVIHHTPSLASLWLVSIGCSIALAVVGTRLSGQHQPSRLGWMALLACAALANLALHNAAAFRVRDLADRRGKFALLEWSGSLATTVPIVVTDRAVYIQLAHYAPPALAGRLTYLPDERRFATFVDQHHEFYIFEAAEIRSLLFGWLSERRPSLSEARSWTPKDLSIEAPAFLYRVRLPARPEVSVP